MLPQGNLLASHSSIYKNLALAATGQLVKGSQAELYHLHFGNTNASVVYVKLYNKATAPTVGTDIPVLTYMLPASGVYGEEFVDPAWFPLGLGIACTTGSANADTTAPGTAIIVDLLYK